MKKRTIEQILNDHEARIAKIEGKKPVEKKVEKPEESDKELKVGKEIKKK